MPPRLRLALTALACAACTPASENILGGNQATESRSGGAAGDALVTVAATSSNPCAATWNSQPVTNDELMARAIALLEQAIDRAGGVGNVRPESLPRIRLEAAPTLTFACVGPVVAALQRAGMAEIMVKPAGSTNQPVSVHAAFPGQPAAPSAIEIGPGTRIAWNGEASDLAAVRARAREIAGPGVPPGMLAVIVAGDVTFASAFQLFDAVAGAQPILLPPGSTLPPPEERGNGLPPPPVVPPR
jgi:hypothetical protein